MTTQEIRPEQRLTIIKHLATGKGLDVVASIIHLDKEAVRQVAQSHGYPDRDKLAWAAETVAKSIEKAARDAIPESDQANRPRLVVSPPAVPVRQAETPQRPDEFHILINAAKQSEKKRIQSLANRILDDCAKLRGLLERETEQDQLKRKIEAEKERARAEVERLEKALADAKAALRGGHAAPTKSRNTAPKGDYPCRNQGCEKHYDTPQGRSLHERMKCEQRDVS